MTHIKPYMMVYRIMAILYNTLPTICIVSFFCMKKWVNDMKNISSIPQTNFELPGFNRFLTNRWAIIDVVDEPIITEELQWRIFKDFKKLAGRDRLWIMGYVWVKIFCQCKIYGFYGFKGRICPIQGLLCISFFENSSLQLFI